VTTERLAEIAGRIPSGDHPWRLESRVVASGLDEWKEGFEIWTATEDGDWVVAEVHDEWAPDQDGGGDEDGMIVTAIDATHDVHPNAASIAQFILHARDDMAWLLAEVDRLTQALAARQDGRESVGFEWGIRQPDGTVEPGHNGAYAHWLVEGTDCTVVKRELRRFYGEWRDAGHEPHTVTGTTDNEGA
jgi:hypothetical protein